jgi:WD40 repeat protein/serine/threonine protein kinase/tetratricopeptide (TPR) repeat protein
MALDTARAKSLFLAASDLSDPAQRAAYLERECGGDAELRGRVEALLRANDASPLPPAEAGDATVDSEAGAPKHGGTGKDTPQPAEAPPQLVPTADYRPKVDPGLVIAGRYSLVEKLGEGGMGEVWVAKQTEPVKRKVALKLIKTGMDSKAVLARFEQERQALAMMDHPNIARVLDGGMTPSGQPFFVMELVNGLPLNKFCDQMKLSPKERLELFVPICQAVQHAHQKGIVHRDLKPANILITLIDAKPVPKVIDFGVAKATAGKLTDESMSTQFGAVVGTLEYMSPEQAGFSGEDIDTRADIYSLGVILYELLTGLRPIDAKRLKKAALTEMARIIREEVPSKPSTRLSKDDSLPSMAALRQTEPRRLMAMLRGELDWVVMKCLEKQRERRYETASGLARDIQRYLADEAVEARPPSAAYRLQKFVSRNKGRVLAASLLLLALVGGIVGTSIGMVQADQARKAETKRAEGERLAKEREADERTKAEIARGEAQEQERIALEQKRIAVDKVEQLAREDYVNRVNRAYREVQDDTVALAEDLLHGCPSERRGWEWHYVKRLCNAERLSLDLGKASVNALAYSPDGTWAVSGSGIPIIGVTPETKTAAIDVWDVSSGKRRKTLPGAKGTVQDVAVSTDGKKIAAGCSDGLVLVWDTATGQNAWTRSDPGLAAMSVAFSPNGKWLAVGYGRYSGDEVGRVKVWDVASGTEIKAFAGPRGGVNKVAFHPDGKWLAVAGSEVVEVWDLETARKLHDLKGHKRWVYCLAYSPNGKWLATGGWDRTVKLRDAATGAEVLTIFAHEGFVLSLAFSTDSRNLVTGSEDRSTRLWDIPSGRRLAAFHGHTDFVQAVAFRPDGREISTGSLDGSIRFWDLKTSRPVVVEHTGWVERLAFRRDGLRFLSEVRTRRDPSETEATKGWNPSTGELDSALAGISLKALSAEFVPGSSSFTDATTSSDGKLFAKTNPLAGSLGASRSKEYLGSAIVIRELVSGRAIHTLTGHSADVVCLAFSPDGRRLATASFDRTVKLWDVQTGQDVFTLRGHTAGVLSLAFSPDGNQLISGGIDGTARVWNATPLPSNVIATHDARYQKKLDTLTQLKATADDARRAEFLASSGHWGMAAEAYARAVEKEPETIQLRYGLVDALLQAGDRSRVGPACDDILKRFGNSGDPFRAMAVTGLCRLALQAIADPEKRQAVHELVLAPPDVHQRAAAPNDAQRALILGKYGLWDLIAAGFTQHVKEKHTDDKPEGLQCFFIQLLSLMEVGDLQGYRSAAGKLLAQFSKTSDPNSLNAVAWYCTYAPDAVADLTVPVLMAEKALAGYPPDKKRFALNTLGAALYRAGRIDEAIARLDESVRASGGAGYPQDWAFLAMAHYKKGNADKARSWLEKARSYKPDEKSGFSMNLVESRMLIREAEALLKGALPARPEPRLQEKY